MQPRLAEWRPPVAALSSVPLSQASSPPASSPLSSARSSSNGPVRYRVQQPLVTRAVSLSDYALAQALGQETRISTPRVVQHRAVPISPRSTFKSDRSDARLPIPPLLPTSPLSTFRSDGGEARLPRYPSGAAPLINIAGAPASPRSLDMDWSEHMSNMNALKEKLDSSFKEKANKRNRFSDFQGASLTGMGGAAPEVPANSGSPQAREPFRDTCMAANLENMKRPQFSPVDRRRGSLSSNQDENVGEEVGCETFPEQLMQVCKMSDLPPGVVAYINSWCSSRGAARLSEVKQNEKEIVQACGLKPFEGKRFMQALEETEWLCKTNGAHKNSFWVRQICGRPRRLIFVRHGESEANADRTLTQRVPDHAVHLTAKGREQALQAGKILKDGVVGNGSVTFIVSPYVRTRETFNGIAQAWKGQELRCREDVRIREMEFGNYDDVNMSEKLKEKMKFGAFYYRFQSGESPADVYDRASIFIETLYRSWEDNTNENVVIVSHGTMILVLLLRFFRWSIEDYEALMPLQNGEMVVLERPLKDPKFEVAYTWLPGKEKNFDGLRRKPGPTPRSKLPVWDGTPDAPLLTSE
mmetsp:Transcript_136103/g.261459  ORF Transcript_136103/g.261459 Transcript_136103/m.261459 type:complete len:584 (-) Transcript_136103:29-1780(-)